jgi:hypothetical protein
MGLIHLHVKLAPVSSHAPPFMHGFGSHLVGFISDTLEVAGLVVEVVVVVVVAILVVVVVVSSTLFDNGTMRMARSSSLNRSLSRSVSVRSE